jgi:hypothetical protein
MTTDDLIVELAQALFIVALFTLPLILAEAGRHLWERLKPRRNRFRR